MNRRLIIAATALAFLSLVAVAAPNIGSAGSNAPGKSIPFKDARLKIEYNATDGDAGLQVFVDAEPWNEITITNPRGRRVVDVKANSVIRNYGLTELFSESSEPPFTEFPFEEFKRLFPEGRYTFSGRTIDGKAMRSTVQFSHKVPDPPQVVSPTPDAVVGRADLVMRWAPVTSPVGVDVVAYEVLVVDNAPALGNPKRVFDVMLAASATQLPVPAEFLVPGTYTTEVLAIDRGGNQTLTAVTVRIT